MKPLSFLFSGSVYVVAPPPPRSYPACMSVVQQREAVREKRFGRRGVEKEDEGSSGSKANTEERFIKGGFVLMPNSCNIKAGSLQIFIPLIVLHAFYMVLPFINAQIWH